MIISVSEFAEDSAVRETLRKSDFVRAETLRRCYAIPDYKTLSCADKNTVYDSIKRIVEQEH